MTESKEYVSWCGMKYRCLNSDCSHYDDYGGRGIKICQEWIDSFEVFLMDMGPMPIGKYSLDRIDNNGNYEPGNCRWGTGEQQAKNRRSTKWIEYNGLRMTLSQWAAYFGINQGNFSRIYKRKSMQEIYSFYSQKQ